VNLFERASAQERADILGKASITQADWDRMNMQQRSEAIGRLTGGLAAVYHRSTPEERVSMLGRCDMNERVAILGRATPQQKADMLGRASEMERSQVFERAVAAVSERMNASMERVQADAQ
jgi:hypothetical protein